MSHYTSFPLPLSALTPSPYPSPPTSVSSSPRTASETTTSEKFMAYAGPVTFLPLSPLMDPTGMVDFTPSWEGVEKEPESLLLSIKSPPLRIPNDLTDPYAPQDCPLPGCKARLPSFAHLVLHLLYQTSHNGEHSMEPGLPRLLLCVACAGLFEEVLENREGMGKPLAEPGTQGLGVCTQCYERKSKEEEGVERFKKAIGGAHTLMSVRRMYYNK